MTTFSAQDMAIAAAKRLAGIYAPMDPGWVKVVAGAGIELADPDAFTITLENGQVFHVRVEDRTPTSHLPLATVVDEALTPITHRGAPKGDQPDAETLQAMRDMTMGNLDFEPTDDELRTAWRTMPVTRTMATEWGWNDTEVRDETCAALERLHYGAPS
jgi:hypothetical protein